MKELKARVTFFEPILGSSPSDPEIYDNFIASKAPTPEARTEEVGAMEQLAEEEVNSMTVFPRMDGDKPCFYDYQVRGFFKSACGMLRNVSGTKSSGIKAYKKYIDGLVFVNERRIQIKFDGEIQSLQRPLRGQTAQGERIALANSEMIENATIEFTVRVLKEDLLDVVREWLDYGQYNGLGQWRNGGYGRFHWEELDADGKVIGGNKED